MHIVCSGPRDEIVAREALVVNRPEPARESATRWRPAARPQQGRADRTGAAPQERKRKTVVAGRYSCASVFRAPARWRGGDRHRRRNLLPILSMERAEEPPVVAQRPGAQVGREAVAAGFDGTPDVRPGRVAVWCPHGDLARHSGGCP
jgi:hypothetical protein